MGNTRNVGTPTPRRGIAGLQETVMPTSLLRMLTAQESAARAACTFSD